MHLLRVRRPADVRDRRVHAEDQQSVIAQQPSGLRHGAARIGEDHGAVVAEDEVEAGVRVRNRLRAGVDKREVEVSRRHQLAGVLELPL